MKFEIGDQVELIEPHPYSGNYGKVKDSAINEDGIEMYIIDLESMKGNIYGEASLLKKYKEA